MVKDLHQGCHIQIRIDPTILQHSIQVTIQDHFVHHSISQVSLMDQGQDGLQIDVVVTMTIITLPKGFQSIEIEASTKVWILMKTLIRIAHPVILL